MIALDGFVRRLREVRDAMGLSQEDFSALGGVKKGAQGLYETGKTPPTVEYLYRLEEHGVDIGYLVTGRRRDAPQQSEREVQLYEMYGKLSERERVAVLALVSGLAGRPADPAAIPLTRFVKGDDGITRAHTTLHDPKRDFRHDR